MSQKATVIAVVNQKGGTGKTTTCENLGVGLAMEGKKVLMVDNDPQASLTISMGWPKPDELDTTLATLMGKDTLTLGTGFRCPHRPGDSLVKNFDFAAIRLPDQGVDLLTKAGPAVGHGHQNAFNPQSRVDLPSHLADGLQ